MLKCCRDTTLPDCGANLPHKTVSGTKLVLGFLQHEAIVLECKSVAMDDLMDEILSGKPYLLVGASSFE